MRATENGQTIQVAPQLSLTAMPISSRSTPEETAAQSVEDEEDSLVRVLLSLARTQNLQPVEWSQFVFQVPQQWCGAERLAGDMLTKFGS